MVVAENGRILNTDFDELMESKRIMFRSMFMEYTWMDPANERLLQELAELIKDSPGRRFSYPDLRGLVEEGIWTPSALRDELIFLVRKNFLSYAPPRAEYALQGRSMEHGLTAYMAMLSKPR